MHSNRHEFFVGLIHAGVLEYRHGGEIWRMKSSRPGWKPKRADTHAGGGYLQVCYTDNGVFKTAASHRIIWGYLHGPIPEGKEVNHKNGDPSDNRPENLELVTHSENIKHAYDVLKRPMSRWRKEAAQYADPEGEALLAAMRAKVQKERETRRER